MKIFHCANCQQLLFFENFLCVKCGATLAYLPDIAEMGSFESKSNEWRAPGKKANAKAYRLCANYTNNNVCNWAVLDTDTNAFCRSCQLTRVTPDLSQPGNLAAWYRLEAAKRRLIYTLITLSLPIASRVEDPQFGLAFEFLADGVSGTPAVLTGHNEGVITVNVAEADDAEREKRRLQMHEPYRTLLGHFRHEIGHYYWDRLIKDSDRLDGFRQLFGDEREDYAKTLERHYQQGIPADWQKRFVSAYASMHAWEDWAETWAHYLHIIDTLETAVGCGLSLRPRRRGDPVLTSDLDLDGCAPESFDQLVEGWFSLTYVLNNLNRGLGMPDAYPFILSPVAIEKLRFVHETVTSATSELLLAEM